jgi:hypothetical protein
MFVVEVKVVTVPEVVKVKGTPAAVIVTVLVPEDVVLAARRVAVLARVTEEVPADVVVVARAPESSSKTIVVGIDVLVLVTL